jgi:hypothetical protein
LLRIGIGISKPALRCGKELPNIPRRELPYMWRSVSWYVVYLYLKVELCESNCVEVQFIFFDYSSLNPILFF